jgi:hypothetical protein
MPQRDYLLRLIEQAGLLLRRMVEQRERNSPHEALQSLMAACERLFGMDAVELFRFTPDQHFQMLAETETPENARDKILIYAALNTEAANSFELLHQLDRARQCRINALRLVIRARLTFPVDGWPEFAPSITDLLDQLGDAPLDDDTAALIASAGVAARTSEKRSPAGSSEP